MGMWLGMLLSCIDVRLPQRSLSLRVLSGEWKEEGALAEGTETLDGDSGRLTCRSDFNFKKPSVLQTVEVGNLSPSVVRALSRLAGSFGWKVSYKTSRALLKNSHGSKKGTKTKKHNWSKEH